MSAPIIGFPRVEHAAARPAKPVWTESLKFSDGIFFGVDSYCDGVFVVWRRIGAREDHIVAPSIDVASSLLMHAFYEAFWSDAGDDHTMKELDEAQEQLNDLLKSLRPFDAILREAAFTPFDVAVKDFSARA